MRHNDEDVELALLARRRRRAQRARQRRALIIAVLLLVAAGGAVGVAVYVGRGQSNVVGGQGGGSEKKVYLREDFKKLVLDKSTEDVLKHIGKPDRTQEAGGMHYWNYYHRTKDPITGKTDPSVQVVFVDGFVNRINF